MREQPEDIAASDDLNRACQSPASTQSGMHSLTLNQMLVGGGHAATAAMDIVEKGLGSLARCI